MKIYYVKIEDFPEEEQHGVLLLLPKIRVEKIKRIKQKNSRLQSIYAGLLLEYALQQMGFCGRSLTFLENADGKPYIAELPDFHYNLTHTKDYVALLIDDYVAGIDMEGLRVGYQKLADRFFSEEEAAVLKGEWSDELFTRLWTRKESYLKATGYGMRMPLEGFSTVESQVKINKKMNLDMVESQVVYYLASSRLCGDYWLSVCRKNEPVTEACLNAALEEVDLKRILEVLCMMN